MNFLYKLSTKTKMLEMRQHLFSRNLRLRDLTKFQLQVLLQLIQFLR